MTTTGTELAVPDEALAVLHVCDADRHMHDGAETCVRAVATPVVTAVLLALADATNTLHGNGGPVYRDGYDRAIGDVRELIADRLEELGVKVEEL